MAALTSKQLGDRPDDRYRRWTRNREHAEQNMNRRCLRGDAMNSSVRRWMIALCYQAAVYIIALGQSRSRFARYSDAVSLDRIGPADDLSRGAATHQKDRRCLRRGIDSSCDRRVDERRPIRSLSTSAVHHVCRCDDAVAFARSVV